jgi:hypothetical protein
MSPARAVRPTPQPVLIPAVTPITCERGHRVCMCYVDVDQFKEQYRVSWRESE